MMRKISIRITIPEFRIVTTTRVYQMTVETCGFRVQRSNCSMFQGRTRVNFSLTIDLKGLLLLFVSDEVLVVEVSREENEEGDHVEDHRVLHPHWKVTTYEDRVYSHDQGKDELCHLEEL